MKLLRILPLAVAGVAVAACQAQAATSGASAPPAAPGRPAPASPAEPMTAAGARAAAQQVFQLYSGGQYAAVYGDLAPADTSQVSQTTYVDAHQQCEPSGTGLGYAITDPVLAGSSAVVSVGLAGAGSALGSETQTFVYANGKWAWQLSASDLSAYQGSVSQIVAAWRAAGMCSAS